MGWCTCRRPGIPYPYAVHEYQGPPRAGAHMGVLDAHVWTGHWFRPFRLYILTSWAGAQVGVQDSHIHMQCVNIKDPKGWCTCGRPGRPCVDLSLVPTIPTLHIDMGQAIMGWCICRRPGLPYPYAGCEYQDPQGLVHMWASWMPMGVPVIGSNHSHSTYGHGRGDHGLVHVWASWNSMCGPFTTSEHSNST